MKKFLLAIAAAAACFTASAFTVEEICGEYEAKDMDLSSNYDAFRATSYSGGSINAISWTMTISQIDGNKVKLTQFLKQGVINGYPKVDFDVEGEFNPDNNTITIQPTNFKYQFPAASFLGDQFKTIAKYDGTELYNSNSPSYSDGNFQSFTAKFDSRKRLTVEAWAMYNTNNFACNLIPAYGEDPDYVDGTYFTYAGGAGLDDIVAEDNAPVEYYTLQGVRVAEPTPGLYIRRQGTKVTKVFVK